MTTATQNKRMLSVTTPLGEDVLLLTGLDGVESVSDPSCGGFKFELEFHSSSDSIDESKILGKSITITLHRVEGSEVYWNGYVSRFDQESQGTAFVCYRAEVVSWLSLLKLRTDSRVFQRKSVPHVIQEVFQIAGFHDFSFRLTRNYPAPLHCNQYQETDFDFVSRLMEEYGISYFFEHENGRHTLILIDDTEEFRPCGQAVAKVAKSTSGLWTEDRITEWTAQAFLKTSGVTVEDYDYEADKALRADVAGDNAFRSYRYPGNHANHAEGENLARLLADQLRSETKASFGKSTCSAFRAGYRFSLEGHYRTAFDQPYILTTVRHLATEGGYPGDTGTSGNKASSYMNEFTCIPANLPIRPARRTKRPLINGCQTATVVGPNSQDELHTDHLGRVKVRFRWDRLSSDDGESSCWIRVSQPWAGRDWGSVAIPRIGQEVIVEFLEGNPDRPIITGSVYNGDQTPPYGLPAGAANMGFKSKTIGGGGYNQVSINDTNGNEGVLLHAHYNMNTTVGNDQSNIVNNNRTEEIKNDEKITVGKNRKEQVGQNETVSIGFLRTHNVGANDMLNVAGAQELSIGGAQMITVGLAQVMSVGLSQQTNVGRNANVKVGKIYVLDAGDEMVFRTGASSLTLKKDGTIVIEGKEITINGSAHVAVNAEKIDLN